MSEQMKRGRAAYAQMKEACALLVESGNWQRVGASDIQLFLDMYTQSLLLKMAQQTGSVSEAMRAFIAGVPSRDVLSIGRAGSAQHRLQEPILCGGHAAAAALLRGDGRQGRH